MALVGLMASTVASCEGGVQVGEAPTTTTAQTTITASPSTTTAPLRKATNKTTVRPRPTSSLPTADEPFEILPEHIEPFLVRPASHWSQEPDAQSGRGPLDIERAAAEEADGDAKVAAEVRKLLQQAGFQAGYSQRWERTYPEGRPPPAHATFGEVSLLLFSTARGAAAYRDHHIERYQKLAQSEDVEEITVGDIPAPGWIGGNDDDGYGGVVLFTYTELYVQVVSESTTRLNDEYRRAVEELARAQHAFLKSTLE
jgi:hypothetical protein